MQSEFDVLGKEYESNVKTLQMAYQHKIKSGWTELWVPNHPTGYIVKACNNCDKIIDMKRAIPGFLDRGKND